MDLRILTWNLFKNRGATNLSQLVSEYRPDIALFQESKSVSFGDQSFTEMPPNMQFGNTVIVLGGSIERIPIREWTGCITGGELKHKKLSNKHRVFVFNVHLRKGHPYPNSYPKSAQQSFAAIHAVVPRDSKLIIGGDFNFYSLHPIVANTLVNRPAGESRVLDEIGRLGLISCWSDCHPNLEAQQTLRLATQPQTPFHCDGIFVPRAWSGSIECAIVDSNLVKISDHNPVVAMLNVQEL